MNMGRISIRSVRGKAKHPESETHEPSRLSLMSKNSFSKKSTIVDAKKKTLIRSKSSKEPSTYSGPDRNKKKELKRTKCHMTFIFDPDGRFSEWMRFIVSLAFLYNFWVIAYRHSFSEINAKNKLVWFFFDYSADLIYYLDILFSLRTGFLEEGVLQTDPIRLRHHYMNTTRFYVDLLCPIPLDILYLSIGYHSILRIFRLVKIYKFFDYLERRERHVNYPNVFRTLVMLHYLFVLFHYNACFSYYISDRLSENFVNFNRRSNQSSGQMNDPFNKYLQVFYYTTKMMTMVGDLPQPVTNTDYVYGIGQLVLALLLFAVIMGHATYIVSSLGNARKDFQSKFAAVKSYMSLRRVPKRLETRVIRWFDFLWTSNKSSDETNVLNMLPCKLRAEISIHVHLDTLKRVEIFQNTEAGFLNELVLKLKPILYSPGDFICRKGEVGKEMYIVNSGKLQVISDDGKVVLATLKAGSYFGEISILNMGALGNRRTASVKSVGYSDLFCLKKEDLWEVLKEYPAVRVKLESIAVKRLEKHKRPLSEIVKQTRCKSLPSIIDLSKTMHDPLNNKRNTLPTNILIKNDVSDLYTSKQIHTQLIVSPTTKPNDLSKAIQTTSLKSINYRSSPQIAMRIFNEKKHLHHHTTTTNNSNSLTSEDSSSTGEMIANNKTIMSIKNSARTSKRSNQLLIDEIAHLKKCLKYLELEYETLNQRLDKQNLTNTYDNQIGKLISRPFTNEFDV